MAPIPQPINEIVHKYIEQISNHIKVDKVLLFGSYANGLYTKHSDIDIAVFSNDFIGMEPIERFRFLFLQAADYNCDLQPLAFTSDDLSKPQGIVAEILNTGLEISITKQ